MNMNGLHIFHKQHIILHFVKMDHRLLTPGLDQCLCASTKTSGEFILVELTSWFYLDGKKMSA